MLAITFISTSFIKLSYAVITETLQENKKTVQDSGPSSVPECTRHCEESNFQYTTLDLRRKKNKRLPEEIPKMENEEGGQSLIIVCNTLYESSRNLFNKEDLEFLANWQHDLEKQNVSHGDLLKKSAIFYDKNIDALIDYFYLTNTLNTMFQCKTSDFERYAEIRSICVSICNIVKHELETCTQLTKDLGTNVKNAEDYEAVRERIRNIIKYFFFIWRNHLRFK